MNCMKNIYEVMMNMKTGIVWRICMKLWWICRHELYEEYVWSYDEYEDRNCMKKMWRKLWRIYCMKNMFEVMMNMKTCIVWSLWKQELYEEYVWSYKEYEDMNLWRICMKLWRIWRQELYEEYVCSYEVYEDRNCTKNMYEVTMNMNRWIVWRIRVKLWWIWRQELYEEYV